MVEELETLVKRVRLLPLAIPLLLLGGWGLGERMAQGISLPEHAASRITAAPFTPRAQLETLSRYMHELRADGEHTEQYVDLYSNHVRPVEASLEKWGISPQLARKVAWPLVEHSYARGLDPATVVAVVLVESSGKPTATSFVGARGLMQVMPIHEGHWGCGGDLYDIESNLCYGTRILAWNLARFQGDEQRALLAYNGCVNGTNTPNCHTYPAKVSRMRDLVRAEWERVAPRSYGAARPGSVSPIGAGP
ncbi:MAG: lytic transglycosylase domain-containing protein [Longimicrobiales bacterium]